MFRSPISSSLIKLLLQSPNDLIALERKSPDQLLNAKSRPTELGFWVGCAPLNASKSLSSMVYLYIYMYSNERDYKYWGVRIVPFVCPIGMWTRSVIPLLWLLGSYSFSGVFALRCGPLLICAASKYCTTIDFFFFSCVAIGTFCSGCGNS